MTTEKREFPCECCDTDAEHDAMVAKFLEPGRFAKDEHVCGVDDGTSCEDCCEHGDMDCGHCMDCGKDCTEDLMAAAYDRAKDAWKYGD